MNHSRRLLAFQHIFAIHTNCRVVRQANITVPSAIARGRSGISGQLPPRSSNIEDIVGRIKEICYQAQRRQIQAIQLNREVEVSDLYSQLQNEWQVLCLRAGFVQGGRGPRLPWDENLLLAPNRNLYHEAVVNLTNDSVHTSLNDRADAARLVLQSTPQRFAVGSPGYPISSAGPERNQVILGDPALPVCVASFVIGERGLRLQHWRIERAAIGRIVVWTGTDPVHTLIHYVPANTMPYTKHSSLKSTEKYHVISFHHNHRVVWNKSGQNRLDKQMPVIYHFVDAKDFKRFQEELRDKDLLDTFNTDTIKSKRPAGRYGEAGNQDLKLWCSRDEAQVYTISFYANHTETEHLEFPINWFQEDISADPTKRTVQLVFAPPTDTSAPFPLPARPSSFMRKLSFARSQSSQTVASSAASTASNSSKASVSTLNSIMSALEGMGGHVEPFAPADVSKVFQHLHITFSDNEPRLKRTGESDFERFVKLYANAHQLSQYPPNPSALGLSSVSEDRAVCGAEAPLGFHSRLLSDSPTINEMISDVQMEDV